MNLAKWRKNSHPVDSVEVLFNSIDNDNKTITTLEKILDKIANAKTGTRILIENGYFVLFPELNKVLIEAVNRGVEITLNLNMKSELGLLRHALKVDLPKMIDMGIKVYLNSELPTHAKMMLLSSPDGVNEVVLTSANFDPRSFHLNQESGVSIISKSLHDRYRQRFELKKSQMVLVEKVNKCVAIYNGSKQPSSATLLNRAITKLIRPQL